MLLKARPKLAFFDIDGTLIGSSGKISLRTKKALATLQAKGINLALATGRPMFGARDISKELEIDCFSLFSSGALIANPKNQKILFEATIPYRQLVDCIKEAKELGLYIELYTHDNYYIEKETELTTKHTTYLGVPPILANLNQVINDLAINKIVTISNYPELDLRQQTLIERAKDLVCLCSKGASHPEITFNNITSKAANRREGFHRIANEVAARPEETIAFGDAKSDLIFIELAALGVAMAEAPAEVKEKANLVADSADDDGVAKVVERILYEMM